MESPPRSHEKKVAHFTSLPLSHAALISIISTGAPGVSATLRRLWNTPLPISKYATAPASTAGELVKQLKMAWCNIQPCAGEPDGKNAGADASLHRQQGWP